MSKSIGKIHGVGSMNPYGYETDYMQYLRGYNPYNYEQTLQNMSVNTANALPQYQADNNYSLIKQPQSVYDFLEQHRDLFYKLGEDGNIETLQPDAVNPNATPSYLDLIKSYPPSNSPEDMMYKDWLITNEFLNKLKQTVAENENTLTPKANQIQNYLYNNDEYRYKSFYGDTPPQMQNNVQQLRMPAASQQQITMPKPQESSTWDKTKDWASNTGDEMQAGAVGYATGVTLGNFDEAV